MSKNSTLKSALMLLLSAGFASAHLDTLIAPKGGFPYEAGKSLIIKWTIGNNHNGIDIHLSTDDKTWTVVAADLAKTQTAYGWTIPADLKTDRARIRICQKSGPQGCTDADSVSNPIDGPLYTLVSGRFRIEPPAPTALRSNPSRAASGISLPHRGDSPRFGWQVLAPASAVGGRPGMVDLRGRKIGTSPAPAAPRTTSPRRP